MQSIFRKLNLLMFAFHKINKEKFIKLKIRDILKLALFHLFFLKHEYIF